VLFIVQQISFVCRPGRRCTSSYHRSDVQGLPVIVTPMGTSGVFSEGEDIGLIVPPGNVDALVQAIQLLAKDEQLRKNMGLLARQRAMLFTWEQVGKRRLDLLLEKRIEWLSYR